MDEQELKALIEASERVHEELKRKLEWVKKHPLEATEKIIELEEKLKTK
ncbi:hypothetical protein [Shouchella clausii]|nr:hypothetical protein [Shouchella clausii]